MVTALDMDNAKILGLVKMDILGTAILDKLMGVNNLLRYGRINV
jgi:DNA polymerase III alpha subunit